MKQPTTSRYQKLTAGPIARRFVEWVVFDLLARIGRGIAASKRDRGAPATDMDLCGVGAVTSMERDRLRGYGDVMLLVEVALICLLGLVLFAAVIWTWAECGVSG